LFELAARPTVTKAMNGRANILVRLRRWKRGAARYVIGSFAVAYLSAGVAPCAMAATRATHDMHAASPEHTGVAHEHHVHGVGVAAHESVPAPADHGNTHCPHCPPSTHGDHAACVALDDLTNVAASHAKDAPQSIAPLLVPAALTLPPAHASPWPPPPSRVARVPCVPLNVQHCVFLI